MVAEPALGVGVKAVCPPISSYCPLWIDFSVTQMQLEQFSSVGFLMKHVCVHFKPVLSMHAF